MTAGSESRSYADLLFTPHDGIGGNSVDNHTCKKQRYQREGPEQPRRKTAIAHLRC
jgi:hypothetical protein